MTSTLVKENQLDIDEQVLAISRHQVQYGMTSSQILIYTDINFLLSDNGQLCRGFWSRNEVYYDTYMKMDSR